MKHNKWSEETWQKLMRALDEECRSNPRPVAAFDADGTLWDADLGESFFRYQIEHCELPGLPADPWRHYRDWKESGDPRPAYLWLAQINEGQREEQVRAWAEASVANMNPLPIFDDQRRWIELLLQRGVEIYIVTASIKWAVEPGARRLGLENQDVIGVQVKVDNGLVTREPAGHMTYREGKPAALLNLTEGRRPFFCAGNTMGDYALLKSATRIAMAVGAANEGDELWKTEDELRRHAAQETWITHRF